MWLTHDVSNKRYREELSHFIENWTHDFCLLGATEAIEFISPKSPKKRIRHFRDIVSAEFFIREEQGEVEERAPVTL